MNQSYSDISPRPAAKGSNLSGLTPLALLRKFFRHTHDARDSAETDNRQLRILYETGMAINSAMGLKETIRLILDEARQQTGASAGKLILSRPIVDLPAGEHAVFYSGFDPSVCEVKAKSRLRGLNGLALKSHGPLRIQDRKSHPGSAVLPPGHIPFESLLSVPLLDDSLEAIGALVLVKPEGARPFNANDEVLLANFANQAAAAIIKESMNEQLRHLSVMEERQKIARNLHDGLGQVFAYLSIETKIVDDLLIAGDIAAARKHLEQLGKAASDTSVDVRETIVNLRTPLDDGQDLRTALETYLKNYAERNAVNTVLTVDGEMPVFSRSAQIQLICIVQEALSNVRKHANATEIRVNMLPRNGSTELWVIDDGKGFVPELVPGHGGHAGLNFMKERAREAGGLLQIKSTPGEGTAVGIIIAAEERL